MTDKRKTETPGKFRYRERRDSLGFGANIEDARLRNLYAEVMEALDQHERALQRLRELGLALDDAVEVRDRLRNALMRILRIARAAGEDE